MREIAGQRARSAFGRERLMRAHPLLAPQSVLLENNAAELARATERVLRKHGKDIAEKQFVQKRIAEVAMDLYGLAAAISRTTRAIEARGEDGGCIAT